VDERGPEHIAGAGGIDRLHWGRRGDALDPATAWRRPAKVTQRMPTLGCARPGPRSTLDRRSGTRAARENRNADRGDEVVVRSVMRSMSLVHGTPARRGVPRRQRRFLIFVVWRTRADASAWIDLSADQFSRGSDPEATRSRPRLVDCNDQTVGALAWAVDVDAALFQLARIKRPL
jgi:hypothetical protein